MPKLLDQVMADMQQGGSSSLPPPTAIEHAIQRTGGPEVFNQLPGNRQMAEVDASRQMLGESAEADAAMPGIQAQTGRVASTGGSFVAGVTGGLGDMVEGLNYLNPNPVTRAAGASLADFLQQGAREAQAIANPRFATTNMVAGGLGSTVPFLAGGAAAGAVGVGGRLATYAIPGAMGAAAGLGSANQSVEDHGLTGWSALLRRVGGTALGATEAIPVAKALERMDGITGGLFSKTLARKVGKPIASALAEATEEAIQELVQTGGEVALEKAMGIERDWTEAIQGAGVGGTVGLLLGGMLEGIGRVRRADMKRAAQERRGQRQAQRILDRRGAEGQQGVGDGTAERGIDGAGRGGSPAVVVPPGDVPADSIADARTEPTGPGVLPVPESEPTVQPGTEASAVEPAAGGGVGRSDSGNQSAGELTEGTGDGQQVAGVDAGAGTGPGGTPRTGAGAGDLPAVAGGAGGVPGAEQRTPDGNADQAGPIQPAPGDGAGDAAAAEVRNGGYTADDVGDLVADLASRNRVRFNGHVVSIAESNGGWVVKHTGPEGVTVTSGGAGPQGNWQTREQALEKARREIARELPPGQSGKTDKTPDATPPAEASTAERTPQPGAADIDAATTQEPSDRGEAAPPVAPADANAEIDDATAAFLAGVESELGPAEPAAQQPEAQPTPQAPPSEPATAPPPAKQGFGYSGGRVDVEMTIERQQLIRDVEAAGPDRGKLMSAFSGDAQAVDRYLKLRAGGGYAAESAIRAMRWDESQPKPRPSGPAIVPASMLSNVRQRARYAAEQGIDVGAGVKAAISAYESNDPKQIDQWPSAKDTLNVINKRIADAITARKQGGQESPPPKTEIQRKAEQARKEFDDEIKAFGERMRGKLSVNAPLDPEVLQGVGRIIGKGVKAGAYTFAEVVERTYAVLKQSVGTELANKIMREAAPAIEKGWAVMRSRNAQLSESGKVADILPDTMKTEATDEVRAPEGQSPGSDSGRTPDVPGQTQPPGGNRPPGGDRDVSAGDTAGPPSGRGAASGLGAVPADAGGDETGRSDGTGVEPGGGGRRAAERGPDEDSAGPGGGKSIAQVIAERRQSRGGGRSSHNHRIAPDDTLIARGLMSKADGNIAAIRLYKQLASENRLATPAEKRVLAKYVGWGQLPQFFDRIKSHRWARYQESPNTTYLYPEDKTWGEKFGGRADEIKELLTESEWDAAARSTQNAHYTSRDVIEKGLWAIAQRLGFQGGTALESSAGIGHILGLTPDAVVNDTLWTAVELDDISSGMLEKMYPEATVHRMGFERAPIANGAYDLVIGNPPFARQGPSDKRYPAFSLHNYMIARAIDAAKPGGILVQITSSSTMDNAASRNFREWAAQRVDLVGAIRLPNNAFKENAGTEVTTDILVFRRRDGSPIPQAQAWMETREVPVAPPRDWDVEKHGKAPTSVWINEYFVEHPDMMLGEMGLEGTMYGPGEPALTTRPGQDTVALLQEAVAKLPESLTAFDPTALVTSAAGQQADAGAKEFSFQIGQDRRIYQVEGGELVAPSWAGDRAAVARATAFVDLRNKAKALIDAQLNPEADDASVEATRAQVLKAYESFLKKHGNINAGILERQLGEDPEYPLVAALEYAEVQVNETKMPDGKVRRRFITTYTPADILTKRTQFPVQPPTKAETPADAIAISQSWKGRLDTDYMASLLGVSKLQVVDTLLKDGHAFRDPTLGTVVARDDYLSGNVREKLARAKEAAESDSAYAGNVAALEAVLPEDDPVSKISVQLGATWVPGEVYEQWLSNLFEHPKAARVEYEPAMGHVTVRWNPAVERSTHNTDTLGAGTLPATKLIERAFALRQPTVTRPVEYTKEDGSKGVRQVTDPENTDAARQRLQELRQQFDSWAKTSEHAPALARTYNDQFNSYVDRKITPPPFKHFPGQATSYFAPRPHQAASVVRGMQESYVMAHEVGTGKTIAFITTAMEWKRLGLAKKTLIVALNSNIGQVAETFKRSYPQARVLYPSQADFEAKNRKRLLSRIATGNWDAIILPHSQFNQLPDDPARIHSWVKEQIDKLTQAIIDRGGTPAPLGGTSRGRSSDPTVKQLERRRQALHERLNKLLDRKTDDTITFEQLGIDGLIVDEAHFYKKVYFDTQMEQVKGLDTNFSERGLGLLMKARFVQNRTGGRNVILATGTPVTNTLAESWNIMRVVRPDLMREWGMGEFDEFVSSFAEVKSTLEQDSVGRWKDVQRLSSFNNAPQLSRLFKQVADVIFFDDLARLVRDRIKSEHPDWSDAQVEEAQQKEVKRPRLKGGKALDIDIKPGKKLRRIINGLRRLYESFEKMTGREKRENTHIPLVVGTKSQKAALDVRMFGEAEEDAPSKLQAVAEHIYKRWKEGAELKTAQVVFADRYRDSSENAKFHLFDALKAKLVAMGIPENEIGDVTKVMGSSKSARAARLNLFNDVNAGNVRVIMGTTEGLGIGVNIQERLAALHHMDAPYRPADMSQREGRMIRQGNILDEVEILRYGMERTFDGGAFQRLARKMRMIQQFLRGDLEDSSMEEVDDEGSVMSYEQAAAAFSGDPLTMRRFELTKEAQRLQNMRGAYQDKLANMRGKVTFNQEAISRQNATLKTIRDWIAAHADLMAQESPKLAFEGKEYDAEALAESLAAKIDVARKTAEAKVAKANDENSRLNDEQEVWLVQDGRIGDIRVDVTAAFKVRQVDPNSFNSKYFIDGDGAFRVKVDAPIINPFQKTSDVATPAGVLKSAMNIIKNRTEREATAIEEHIAARTQTVAELKQAISQPFKYQDDLDKTAAELAQVVEQLKVQAKKESTEDDDDGPMEIDPGAGPTDAMPRRKGKGKAKKDGPTDPMLESGKQWMREFDPLNQHGGKFARRWKDGTDAIRRKLARYATREAGMKQAEVDSLHEIIADMARRLNLGKPGTGGARSLGKTALGFFRQKRQNIRMFRSNDLDTFIHEVGHYLHEVMFKRSGRKSTDTLGSSDFPKRWSRELVALGKALYGNRKPTSGYASEGWAETVRMLMFDPANLKKQAPTVFRDTTRILTREYPEVWAVLREGRARAKNLDMMRRHDPILGWIDRKARSAVPDTWENAVDWGRTLLFDRFQRLSRMNADLGLNLPANTNPHMLALRHIGHISGQVRRLVEYGRWSFSDPSQKIGPGVKEVLSRLKNEANLELWERYMVARRVREKRGQGFTVMPDADNMPKRGTDAAMDAFIRRVETAHPEWGDFFRERGPKSQNADGSETGTEDPDTIAAQWRDLNNWVIDWLVHRGMLTSDAATLIKEKNVEYIPFHSRPDMDATKGRGSQFSNRTSGLKRFRNSRGEQIIPPVNAYLAQLERVVTNAELNRVARSVTNLWEKEIPGVGRWLDKIQRPWQGTKVSGEFIREEIAKQLGINIPEGGGAFDLPPYLEGLTDEQVSDLIESVEGIQDSTLWRPAMTVRGDRGQIRVMVDGKPQFYEIKDRGLFQVMEGMVNPARPGAMLRAMGFASGLLRTGAAELNPSFSIPNFFRDLMQAVTMTAKTAGQFGKRDTLLRLQAMRQAFTGGNWHDLFLASGADMAGLFGEYYDPKTKVLSFDDLFEKNRLGGLVKGDSAQRIVRDIFTLGSVRRFNHALELANRLAEFAAVYEQQGDIGKSVNVALATAGQAAADVTLDFQRGGTLGKELNQAIPFSNAALIGGDKLYRFIKENPRKAAGRIFAAMVIPSILSMLMNWDDEEYWALPLRDRDRYWFIPIHRGEGKDRTWFRVPKPYGLAAFSIATERMVANLGGINPTTGERGGAGGTAGSALLAMVNELRPSMNFALFQPMMEVAANYSFYRQSPIVPLRDQNLPDALQGADRASEFSRFMGGMMDVSPAKIDYLVQGFFGGLGKDVVSSVVDPTLRGVDWFAGGKLETHEGEPLEFADWLIVRRFLASEPRSTHEAIRRFFDDYEGLRARYNGLKRLEKEKPDQVRAYREKHAEALRSFEQVFRPAYNRLKGTEKFPEGFTKLRQLYRSRARMKPSDFDRQVNQVHDSILRVIQDAYWSQNRMED